MEPLSRAGWLFLSSDAPRSALDERAPQRAWEQELARFRDEAERLCEARIGERPRVVPGKARFGELTWDGDAAVMDPQLRSVAAELTRRDLVLGALAERFWRADGWAAARVCDGVALCEGAARDESLLDKGEAGAGEGVHRGMLTVDPPASAMRWRLGRGGHTVVQSHRRVRVDDGVIAR
jgi:hypothetical protein